MEEYYFLFALAFIWTIFAVIVDLKKREVPNWISFSLIAFALAYRGFYSIFINDWSYFLLGVFGFSIFFALAYGFYYARAFAGGDAKLLMGFGIILPYNNFNDFGYYSIIFISSLFLLGVVYSLIYSVFIAIKRRKKFTNEFERIIRENGTILLIFTALIFSLSLLKVAGIFSLLFLIVPFFYVYVKSLDKCMIGKVHADKLSEGDWLEKEVKIGKHIIRKSVHGLNNENIKLLRKFGKAVYIKEGIPFTPAFLFALITVFFFLVLQVHLFSFLF